MERSNGSIIIIGIVALTMGIVIKLIVGKRRFYRRNQAGIEEFKNYRRAFGISLIERIFIFLSSLIIIVGVALLVIASS